VTGEAGLSGPERVAALLLSLEKQAASTLLKHLGPSALTEVAEAMTSLDPERASHEAVKALFRDLAVEATGPRPVRAQGDGELSALLSESLGPQRAREVVAEIAERRLHERPFLAIEDEAPETLAAVLKSESAAVGSLVLAHLDPSSSAAVLSTFEPEQALDVVKRMATLRPPGVEMLRSIADDLAERIRAVSEGAVASDPEVRLKTIAEMLNFTAEDIEQSVLEGLSTDDADIAQEIREHMFAWDDLATIDKRSMQKILGSVDTRTLAMSLKGAAKAVEENIMSNLSARVRDMVTEERELAGAVPMSEVAAARDQLMTMVRNLIESGEFSPARSGEDLVS